MARRTKSKQQKKQVAEGTKECFTIMPFGGSFDECYEEVFRPAIERAGLHPRRADDVYASARIMESFQVIRYDKNKPFWGRHLGDEITAALAAVLSDPKPFLPTYFMDTEKPGRLTVTEHDKEFLEIRQKLDQIGRDVRSSMFPGRLSAERERVLRYELTRPLNLSDLAMSARQPRVPDQGNPDDTDDK